MLLGLGGALLASQSKDPIFNLNGNHIRYRDGQVRGSFFFFSLLSLVLSRPPTPPFFGS